MNAAPGEWPKFSTAKYRPDGGCSFGGWLALQGTCALTGALLGLLTAFLAQWIYLIYLFPLAIGAAIGFWNISAIQRFKVRSVWLASAGAILGGTSAVAAMHAWDYHAFQTWQRNGRTEAEFLEIRQIALHLDEILQNPPEDPDFRAFVEDLAKHPDIVDGLKVNSFREYIDYAAKQGVTITSVGGHGGDRKLQLGYAGSYGHWAIEWLLMAGLPILILHGEATEPFCSACQEWKRWRILGSIVDPEPDGRLAVEQGDLEALSELNPLPELGASRFSVCVCPRCASRGTIEVQLDQNVRDDQGRLQTKPLALMTYPGDALPLFLEMFDQDGSAASETDRLNEPSEIARLMQQADEPTLGPEAGDGASV